MTLALLHETLGRMWRLLFIILPAAVFLTGCETWKAPKPIAGMFPEERTMSLEEYLNKQRELNEQYLYGDPAEALKSLEALAKLEEDYARLGQRPIDSNHARMLAYSRLFVMSEKFQRAPEAQMYLDLAMHFAAAWRPEIGALPKDRREEFVRTYVENFEKGLEVRWKKELK